MRHKRREQKMRCTRLSVCVDCYFRSVNDEVQSDEHEQRWRAANALNTHHVLQAWCTEPDHHDVITGEHVHETTFSKQRCDWCGDGLAGARFCAASMRTRRDKGDN
jgi:hypothetical protein